MEQVRFPEQVVSLTDLAKPWLSEGWKGRKVGSSLSDVSIKALSQFFHQCDLPSKRATE
jgi:hypothetical protein